MSGWLNRLRGLDGRGLVGTLVRGASVFLSISIAGTGITFLLHVLLARLLGSDSYGQYAYAVNWMAILVLGSQLGYQHASVRYVSQYNAQDDVAGLAGFLRTSARDVLIGSFATAVVILVGVEIADRFASVEASMLNAMRMLALLVPAMGITAVWSGRLRGFKAVSASQVPSAIVQPTVFAAIMLAATFVGTMQPGAAFAVGAHAASALIAFAISFVLLARLLATRDRGEPRRDGRAEWRSVARSFMAVTSVQIARNRLGILIVGYYHVAAEVGFFTSAKRIATLAIFGLTAVAAWASPMISEYHASGRQQELQRLARIAAWCTTGFSVPATLVIAFFGEEILGLFGPAFRVAYEPLLIIAVGQLVNAVTGPVGYLLTMTGNQSLSVRIEATTAATAIVLCLVLVPRYGLLGAAWADAIANVFRNLALYVAVWRRLGIRASIV